MDLIERLESLRIPDSEFFNISYEKQCAYTRANAMLDDCLDIIYEWLKEKDLLKD